MTSDSTSELATETRERGVAPRIADPTSIGMSLIGARRSSVRSLCLRASVASVDRRLFLSRECRQERDRRTRLPPRLERVGGNYRRVARAPLRGGPRGSLGYRFEVGHAGRSGTAPGQATLTRSTG